MSWPLVAIQDVAPSKPLKLNKADENIWQVTLDNIEPDTGLLLERVIRPFEDAGVSTHGFDDRYVLYSKLRPYLNKVLLPDDEGLCTTELIPLLPDSKRLNRNYLAHYLKSKDFVNWISNQTAGAKMPRVSMDIFWGHQIPLPPLAEQKRIAAILDKADAIRHKRQQAIKLADEFLRSVFLDMFGDPVTNPKGWDRCDFEYLTDMVTYGLTVRPEYHEEGIPLISAKEIRSGEIDFGICQRIAEDDFNSLSSKARPQIGDILFSKTGSIGHCAMVEENITFAITQNAARIVPNRSRCIPEFLIALLRTKYFYNLANKEAKGNAVKDLQLGVMKGFLVYLPPIEMQQEYVKLADKSKQMIKKIEASSEVTMLSFNALSQKAFSGSL